MRLYAGSLGTLGILTEVVLRLRPLPESRAISRRYIPSLASAIGNARDSLNACPAPSAVAVLPEETGGAVLSLFEGAARDVSEAAGLAGDSVPESDWEAVGQAMIAPTDRVLVRLAARPGDTLEIATAVHDEAGRSALRVLLPCAGIVIADLGPDRIESVLGRAARAGWLARVESASESVRGTLDVFGVAPGALPLMRALKQRFDPSRVLSPGRFVGRI